MDGLAREVLPDGTIRLSSTGHSVWLRRLKPGVLMMTTVGIERGVARKTVMQLIDEEIAAAGSVTLYCDMRDSQRVDSSGRDEWSAFGKAHRGSVKRAVFLVNSKLLEMAMSVMGMFVGGDVVRTVSREDAFVDEIAREVPGFRAVPRYAQATAPSR